MNDYDMAEDSIVEVLITTFNNDNSLHTKPFGLRIVDGDFYLNLYPNQTLNNIKNNNSFIIQFANTPMLYVKSLFGLLDSSDYDNDYLKDADFVLYMQVNHFNEIIKEDVYGPSNITQIMATPQKSIKLNEGFYTIDRSTCKIMELLVDYTRIDFMDESMKEQFMEKVRKCEEFIDKNSNKTNKEALKIIKKEIKKKI